MAPGNVNNAMRSQMADVRKWQLDTGGAASTAGAGNSYTLTVQQNFAAYSDGMRFTFRANRANTGSASLNVNGVGAVVMRIMRNGINAVLNNGDIQEDSYLDVVYSQSQNAFIILNRQTSEASSINMASPGLLGRSASGAGPARILTPGDGLSIAGTGITAVIGAGLQFAAGAIVAVVQRFATEAEALAGTLNDAAMTPLRVAQFVNARTIGRGQSWQDLTGVRAANTTYQNLTGSPIQLLWRWASTAAGRSGLVRQPARSSSSIRCSTGTGFRCRSSSLHRTTTALKPQIPPTVGRS